MSWTNPLDCELYTYSPCCRTPDNETCASPIVISESLADLENSFLRQFQATCARPPPDCPGQSPCGHKCHRGFPPIPPLPPVKIRKCIDSYRICDEKCTTPATPPRCPLQSDSCPALVPSCPALTPPCPALTPPCPARDPPTCPARSPKSCVDSRKLCEEQCSLRASFESLPSPCPSYLEELVAKFETPLNWSSKDGDCCKIRSAQSSPKRTESRFKSFFSRCKDKSPPCSPKKSKSPPCSPDSKKKKCCRTPPKSPCGTPCPPLPCPPLPCAPLPCPPSPCLALPCPPSPCPASPRLRLCSSPPKSPPCSPPGSPCSRIPRPCSPKPACPGSPRARSCAASPRPTCCRTPQSPSRIPCPKSPSCSPRPRSPCSSIISRPCKPPSPCGSAISRPPCKTSTPCERPICPTTSTPCKTPCDIEPRCPPQQSSVASTLMDIVSKIASYAKPAQAECKPEDCTTVEMDSRCSQPCPRPPRRCVHFLPPPKSCARDLEELFFNQDIKKSNGSMDCDLCDECEKQSAPPCGEIIKEIKLESCPAAFPQESGACSSLDSVISGPGGGACDAARAHYYHSKLLATLQILQNKEETVRVQAESLAVAEQRIATLTCRAAQMRKDLERNACELRALRKSSCCASKNAGTQSPTKEVESQKHMVVTLQNNLSVIEDLYRECFYETAKQEELIENLRKSYLDVRLMEKEKSDQIGRLQNALNSQKWSLEQCQDIALEVENLKLEISNFLNNSNNDSGMWEGSVAGEVGEELQDIMTQLRQLRDLLQNQCDCGLQEENRKLKERNQALECEMGECQRKTCELQCALESRDEALRRYKKQIDENNEQMACLRQELQCLQQREEERQRELQCLQAKLQEATAALEEKCAELCSMQEKCSRLEETVCSLRQDLERADCIIKENCRVRSEVSYLSQQVCLWRRQLADSEARLRCVETELQRARDHARSVEHCYRQKAQAAAALEEQLAAAHERGAELCAEARRVVGAVRDWVRRMRATNCEQEEKIKEQEACISRLQQQLSCASCGPRPRPCAHSCVSRVEVGCSKCAPRGHGLSTTPTPESSANECPPRAPPPRRPPRKIPASYADRGPHVFRCLSPGGREASVQQPARAEAAVSPQPERRRDSAPQPRASRCSRVHRTISPTEELFDRVERLSEALADGQRRWSRTRLPASPR